MSGIEEADEDDDWREDPLEEDTEEEDARDNDAEEDDAGDDDAEDGYDDGEGNYDSYEVEVSINAGLLPVIPAFSLEANMKT